MLVDNNTGLNIHMGKHDGKPLVTDEKRLVPPYSFIDFKRRISLPQDTKHARQKMY